MQTRTALGAAISGLLMSLSLAAQQPPAAAGPAAGPSSSSSLSSSLGVYVFPAQNQTTQQQSSDEGSCFGWAKSQTGIDPMAIKPQQASAPQTSTATAGGAPVKGAVAGAAGGAAIGAIAGDAGKGAAIGATTGVLAGAAAKRHARKEAAAEHQQEQQQEQQQAQASVAQQKATYNKAFSACMQGKGYTVN